MEFKCLARCAGLEPVFGKGQGDVNGYCLACENFIKMSYQHQVMKGRMRQSQKEMEAAIRKSIKVGRRTDAAGCWDRKVAGFSDAMLQGVGASFVCCLQGCSLFRCRLQAFGMQDAGCRLFGCRLQACMLQAFQMQVAGFSDAGCRVFGCKVAAAVRRPSLNEVGSLMFCRYLNKHRVLPRALITKVLQFLR